MIRPMTEEELDTFKGNQHFWFEWFIDPEGEYIYDPDLKSWVLVFKLQDGTVEYGIVDDNYSAGDIDPTDYYNAESWNIFWSKAEELSEQGLLGAAGSLAEGVGEGIKNVSKYAFTETRAHVGSPVSGSI